MERADWIDSLRRDIVFEDTLRGQHFVFHTTWGLFSPRAIDEGTRLLLDRIEVPEDADCFDLGCGYGPIGMTLATLAPEGRTLLADKDFVAVEYARRNLQLNGIDNAEAILSNAFDQVGDRQFDLVASNIPAKVGKEMLALIIEDAYRHLRPGGRFWVVSINGLRQLFKREFNTVFGNYTKVKQGRNYTVSMATKES
ncbi:MAG: class I SAM-dependent methyltransferase [Gammaproteobacteria bacterium]|nr:MAG: class I SAM-dependent methyltransferase [Gammaproteobacteria bacterium]